MIRLTPILALMLAGCGVADSVSEKPSPPPDLNFPVGHFSLTERSGRTITEKDLEGSVWVASFVFTRCTGPCPAVTGTIAKLQNDLRDVPQVKFVTFTVDPKRDDMTALREYAKSRNADPERWLFLTGDETTIHKMMREQFKQAIERKTGEDAKPGDEFGHSTRLLLVDRHGMIRASFDGLPNEQFPDGKEQFDSNLSRLKERVRELVKD
jgi:cytochrome oxidase Cu insertion factor (SCO1/SenC/PrrC family)